ncbi:DUF4145 domain-containing protein [Actinoplanes italicus]|uniref:DUF4145 domain-containing protein n=1 Tax=Actinoplanes italicus TaxID=113567 RepID=UPI0011B2734C|nr:DUF4145 domain-containing protein [Actinoplanes italicus]
MDHPLLPLTDWFFNLPHIICPTCSRGHLEKRTKFYTQRSGPSHQAENERPDEFEPEWVLGVFTGMLSCSLAGCWETVAVAGDYETVQEPTEYGSWTEQYRLRFARPAPSIVDCPARTPRAVREATDAAAAVIWTDPAGAAGRLRVAIEELMTAQNVTKTRIVTNQQTQKRHRRHRMADERIKEFARTKPDVADVLLAVKWIGNSGSHESGLSAHDVLEGAQMFSHALRLLYDPSQSELLRRVALVNKRRGPAPRKTVARSRP